MFGSVSDECILQHLQARGQRPIRVCFVDEAHEDCSVISSPRKKMLLPNKNGCSGETASPTPCASGSPPPLLHAFLKSCSQLAALASLVCQSRPVGPSSVEYLGGLCRLPGSCSRSRFAASLSLQSKHVASFESFFVATPFLFCYLLNVMSYRYSFILCLFRRFIG